MIKLQVEDYCKNVANSNHRSIEWCMRKIQFVFKLYIVWIEKDLQIIYLDYNSLEIVASYEEYDAFMEVVNIKYKLYGNTKEEISNELLF